MRKFRLAIKIVGCFLMATITTLVILILYPEKLFARHMSYRNVSIHSDDVVNQYSPIIDAAITMVQTSELYDPHYKYDIFVTGRNFYRSLIRETVGITMAQSIDNNILLNARVDFSQNKIFNLYSKRNLEETIAHEMIHCLQLHKYGMLRFNPIHQPPVWKTEGYPEYIASLKQRELPEYDFKMMVERLISYSDAKTEWVEITPGYIDPLIYYKGRILIEYLITVLKMTFESILKSKLTEQQIYDELVSWYEGF